MVMSSKRRSIKKTLDRHIWDWYCETCLKNGKRITKNSLQARAKLVYQEAGILDFKASDGWYRRFIQRWRDSEPNSEPVSNLADGGKIQIASGLVALKLEVANDVENGTLGATMGNDQSPSTATIVDQQSKDVDSVTSEGGAEEFSGEIIDCLSKFIDTSELSQTSMDFFYDSEDSSFSTTRNALLLAETENQSEGSKARHRKRGERYLPRFKEKVLSFVARHQSIKLAAAKFKIHGTTISHWRREQAKNGATATSVVAKETVPADQRLVTWLRRCRERGVEVSAGSLAGMAAELAGEAGSPRWLAAWAGRLAQVGHQDLPIPSSHRQSQLRYPSAFKAEVAAFAHATSQAAAAKLFAVSRRRVFDWLQTLRRAQRREMAKELPEPVLAHNVKPIHQLAFLKTERPEPSQNPSRVKSEMEVEAPTTSVSSQTLLEDPALSLTLATGWSSGESQALGSRLSCSEAGLQTQSATGRSRRRLPCAEVDAALWAWYVGLTPRPTNQQVCAKGVELYAVRGVDVKCSRGWHRRWCRRHGVALRFHADDRLLQWTLTRLEANKSVSHHDLQVHAMRLFSARKPGFKASAGWALRFCRRHPALLCAAPTLDTPLPPHLGARVTRFRQTVQATIREANLPLGSVGSVDELHLCFGNDPDQPEPNKPLLRRPSGADCHATVVLGCLADGTLLPPTIILKGSPDAACSGASSHPSATLDVDAMLRWLAAVWSPAVGARSLLLADAFPAHSAAVVREAARALGTDVRVMPGACAAKLQPLTVAVSHMVKTQVMRRWQSHNAAAQPSWDPGPKVVVPEPAQVVAWVNDACANVRRRQQETIRRSFLVTGLTVAANGSEDHFVENVSMIPVSGDC